MELIVKAVTTVESYAEKRQEAQGDCDDVKCKLCEYQNHMGIVIKQLCPLFSTKETDVNITLMDI